MHRKKTHSLSWIKKKHTTQTNNIYVVDTVKRRGTHITEFYAYAIECKHESKTIKHIYSKVSDQTDMYVGKDFERALKIQKNHHIKGVIVKQTFGQNKGMPLLIWCFYDEKFIEPKVGQHSMYTWKRLCPQHHPNVNTNAWGVSHQKQKTGLVWKIGACEFTPSEFTPTPTHDYKAWEPENGLHGLPDVIRTVILKCLE